MTQRQNTNNPCPSNALADLNDNTITIDEFVNSKNDYTTDRFGNQFKTKHKILNDLEKSISEIKNESFLPISGGSVNGSIDAKELTENGVRVYSPNNKPTADEIGALTVTKTEVDGEPTYTVGVATDYKNGLKSNGEDVLTKTDLPEQTGIGINQKWVNVTENRKNGITYTNTTGQTIVVCINADFNADSGQLVIDDVLIATRIFDGTYARSFITFLVPPNSTYQINNASAIWSWSELR